MLQRINFNNFHDCNTDHDDILVFYPPIRNSKAVITTAATTIVNMEHRKQLMNRLNVGGDEIHVPVLRDLIELAQTAFATVVAMSNANRPSPHPLDDVG